MNGKNNNNNNEHLIYKVRKSKRPMVLDRKHKKEDNNYAITLKYLKIRQKMKRLAWSIKELLLIRLLGKFFLQDTAGSPEQARYTVALHLDCSGGQPQHTIFDSSCLLIELAM